MPMASAVPQTVTAQQVNPPLLLLLI